MSTYHVHVERGERYWLVYVAELDRWTQARALQEVEPMARDLIAAMENVSPAEFALKTEIRLPDDVVASLQEAEALRAAARRAQSEAAEKSREAARLLVERGLSRREIGAALGVSYQRAQQLVSS